MQRITTLLLPIIGLLVSCGNPPVEKGNTPPVTIVNPTNKVVLKSEIVWEVLNPARGKASPQAGTIWGDRRGSGGENGTGFLAKFVDGFSSPPHIHNVTYRAVVISGLVHNDDSLAANMWMKPTSFWTQPVGEAHITSAKGEETIALVEIDKGPYLVKPTSEAFDSGERPINIDASNVVWLNNKETNWVDSACPAEISFLLESNGERSMFVKLPVGFDGSIETLGSVVHSVVIQGELGYEMPDGKEKKDLVAGSYFGSTARAIHTVVNNSEEEIIIYIRTNGELNVK